MEIRRSRTNLKTRQRQSDDDKSYDTIHNLQKQLDQQKNVLDELLKTVQENRQTRVVSNPGVQSSFENNSIRILNEIKTIKRQLQKIEDGPNQQPYMNQFLGQPQMPQVQPIPQPMQSMMYQPPYYNPYQYGQFQPFQYPQVPYNPYYPMPYYQQPQISQDQQKKDQLKQSLIKMLRKGQLELQPPKESNNQSRRKDRDLQNSYYHHKNADPLNVSHKSRDQQLQSRDYKSRGRPNDDRSLYNQSHRSLNKSRSNYYRRDRPIDKKRRMELRTILVGAFWYARTVKTLLTYCKKVWNARHDEFQKSVPAQLTQFDSEFQLDEFIVQFVLDCNQQQLLSKDWVFVGQSNPTAKCKLALQVVKIVLGKAQIIYKKLSDQHKGFIKQFTKPKYGYLLQNIHPKFVTDRIYLRPDKTMGPLNLDQQKLLLLDYTYLGLILPKFLFINQWYSNFNKIPNVKLAVKTIVSILHQLYLDKFQSLTLHNQDLPYNKVDVLFCDFSKPKYEECVKSIDEKDTNFHPTANFSIIGLYNKDELVEIYKDPLMKEIQGIFDAYVDTIYEMLK
ncbi:hypothetical protein pb186bvf_019595 [Paramecium bursaria]